MKERVLVLAESSKSSYSDREDLRSLHVGQNCAARCHYIGFTVVMVVVGAVVVLLVCLSGPSKTRAQNQVFKTVCPPGTFPCKTGDQCFNTSLRCDGRAHCPDGSDEGSVCDEQANEIWNILIKKPQDVNKGQRLEGCELKGAPSECVCQDGTKIFCDNKTLLNVPDSLPVQTTYLDLSLNRITELGPDEFQSLTQLETLIVRHSYLEYISPGTFNYSIKMQKLNLNFNSLTNFSTAVFSPVNNLIELSLKGNHLTELGQSAISNMSFLRKIDLSQNRISDIHPNALEDLPSLETVDLRRNELTEIKSHYFSDLGSLKQLFLSGNRIIYIEPGSFLALNNLQIIDLFKNAIQAIENGMFDGLHNLTMLSLAANQISSIQGKAFKDLAKVTSVNLKSNLLKRLENETFKQMLGLRYIYFDKFYMCLYASQAQTCEPLGDGISSKQNLLGNMVLRICVWVVALLACGGNIMVILGRFLMREDNHIHSFFIKNLSLADLFMGVYLLVIAVKDIKFRGEYILHDEVWRNSWECDLSGFLSTLSTEMSVLTLSVITLDRYISIMYPLSLRKRGLKVAYMVMILTWLVCVVLAVLPITGIEYFGSSFYNDNAVCVPLHLHEPRAKGWEYSSFLVLGINFGSFAFIAYAYVAMFYTIHMSALPLRTSRESQERSLVKRFSFIVVTDFMCWIPIIIIKIMALGGVEISGDLYAWVIVFALPVNSALNPLLYTLTTNLFKKKLLSKFTIVFRSSPTQSQSSFKSTSLIRQMQHCEMDLLKHHHRSPSGCTVKTYLAPRDSDRSGGDTPTSKVNGVFR